MARCSVAGLRREEIERRVNRAEELLIEETTSSGAARILMNEFGVKERAAWRYLERARARWAKEAAELGPVEREAEREQMRRTLRHVKSKSFQRGELRNVLGATKQLRELDGLDVPRELRITGAIGVADVTNEIENRSTSDLIAFLRTGRFPIESGENAEG